jgi:hypothetical protein
MGWCCLVLVVALANDLEGCSPAQLLASLGGTSECSCRCVHVIYILWLPGAYPLYVAQKNGNLSFRKLAFQHSETCICVFRNLGRKRCRNLKARLEIQASAAWELGAKELGLSS